MRQFITDTQMDRYSIDLKLCGNHVRVYVTQDSTQRGKYVDLSAATAMYVSMKMLGLALLAFFGRH